MFACRTFEGEARKIAQLLNQMTRDLGGRRELSKLSRWLATYSAGARCRSLKPFITAAFALNHFVVLIHRFCMSLVRTWYCILLGLMLTAYDSTSYIAFEKLCIRNGTRQKRIFARSSVGCAGDAPATQVLTVV